MCSSIHDVHELHLVGVAAMLVASKYEEVYPLRMSVVYEKIAHKKLSTDSIRKKEREILSALNYELTGVNLFELISVAIESSGMTKSPAYTEKVSQYALSIAKIALLNYDLISTQKQRAIAAGCIHLALRILDSQTHTTALIREESALGRTLEVPEPTMHDISQKMLAFIKTFEKTYPNLENLKKFSPTVNIIFEEAKREFFHSKSF